MRSTKTRWMPRLAGGVLALAFLGCPGVMDSGQGGDRMLAGVLAADDGHTASLSIVTFEPSLAVHRVPGTVGADPAVAAIQVRLDIDGRPAFDLVGTHDPWGGFEATGGGWSVRGGMGDLGGEVEVTGPAGFAAWGVVAEEEPEEDSVLAGYCYCRPIGLRPTCVRCTKDSLLCCAADPVLPDDPVDLPPPALFPECPPG